MPVLHVRCSHNSCLITTVMLKFCCHVCGVKQETISMIMNRGSLPIWRTQCINPAIFPSCSSSSSVCVFASWLPLWYVTDSPSPPEFCQWDVFRAACPADHVLLMTSATYNNNNNKFILIWRIKHTSLCALQTNC